MGVATEQPLSRNLSANSIYLKLAATRKHHLCIGVMSCNRFHRSLPHADVSLSSRKVTRQAFPAAKITLLARVAEVLQSYVGLKLTHTLLYQLRIPFSFVSVAPSQTKQSQ